MDTIKLHLGCGKRYLKDYIHIDIADYPHIDHNHDIRTLPMFQDNSVDLIYSSHTLEYFTPAEAREVLSEWHRALKKNGVLRLAVPDFESLGKVYEKYKDLKLILGPLFGEWPIEKKEIVLNHKTVYDHNSLKALLESIGFHDVRPWDWRKIFTGDLEGYDDFSQAYIPHMDKDNGLLISLNLEAQK